MIINVVKTVQGTLHAFPEWKPFRWHRNKKGQFELDFKKNIKQVINYNYQGVEITAKDFVVILSQGVPSDDSKGSYYQIELKNLEKTKTLYLKKQQGLGVIEKGDPEKALPQLAKFSCPYFYLVQEHERKQNLASVVLTQNLKTK